MKKYSVLFGAAIMVMVLAAPAMAQFSSWGHMEFQTVWERSPDFNTGNAWANGSGLAVDSDTAWRQIRQRYRFYMQYGDPKTVRAVLGFEADSTDWGEAGTGTVTGGKMGVYRADQVQLEIKHAYLDFMIPNTPLQVMVGVQSFAYGGRLWMNNDAPGIILATNFAPHKIQAFWWRENDLNRNTYGVNDTYGLAWDMVQKQFNVYAYGAYKNDLYTGNLAAVTNKYDDHPWWIGAGGGFRPGNFNFSGQFVYNGGTRKFTTPGLNDSDYSGFAAELSAKYQIGPGMFFGLEGFYATGQDADDSDKIKIYTFPTGSESQSIFGNDRTVFMWMNASHIGYSHNRELNFGGFWYGRANFEYSPTAWVRMNLNYLYIGDTGKGTPGSYSATQRNPFTKATSGTKAVNTPVGSRTDKDEDFVGHEINLITSLNIYKNFVYHIGIYYFIPGDVYDTPTKDADASYGINTKLNYAF
jgi:hypothetical protein